MGPIRLTKYPKFKTPCRCFRNPIPNHRVGSIEPVVNNINNGIFIGLSPFPVIVEMKVYRDSLLKM